MTNVKTRSGIQADECRDLLRARTPFLWVVTKEEDRVERYLFEAAIAAKYVPRTWDVGQGVADLSGKVLDNVGGKLPDDAFEAIRSRMKGPEGQGERGAWIMRDLPVWFGGGPAGAMALRQARNLARALPGIEDPTYRQSMIVISPDANVPPELAGHTTLIEWPLPDRNEIGAILDTAMERNSPSVEPLNGNRDAAIDAAVGLTGEDAAQCFNKSLVQFRRIDVPAITAEKKKVIARERVLEWHDPLPGGLDAVGGLDGLKFWLRGRVKAYSPAARAYGLPLPKGLLLVGVSGCGKSLSAKAIATMFGVPLLRLDLGALKGKFVGESEGNLRKAIQVIEAIGRCVVWLDEIEKALAGATQGAADGGVSSDALGTILTWMQERKSEAFVVATCNSVESLPPEMLRKGRFDEVFFVDCPNAVERAEVVKATLAKHGRKKLIDTINAKAVADASDTFTGAEVAELIPEAMLTAFNDGQREPTTDDLVAAAKQVVPLARTAKAKIDALREWAKTRARPATELRAVVETERKKSVRAVDLD